MNRIHLRFSRSKSQPFQGVAANHCSDKRLAAARLLRDPQDRPGNLRVGAADERLDALLEQEAITTRASSLPPSSAARRLAAGSCAGSSGFIDFDDSGSRSRWSKFGSRVGTVRDLAQGKMGGLRRRANLWRFCKEPLVPPGLNGTRSLGEPPATQPTIPGTVRSLELPALPHPAVEGSALPFGDWLVLTYPLMSDLSATSQQWWEGP